MSTASKKITLRALKTLNTIWHPESTLVFKSKNDKVVIGRYENDQLIPLDEKALDLCSEWRLKYDSSLIEEEEEESGEEVEESGEEVEESGEEVEESGEEVEESGEEVEESGEEVEESGECDNNLQQPTKLTESMDQNSCSSKLNRKTVPKKIKSRHLHTR